MTMDEFKQLLSDFYNMDTINVPHLDNIIARAIRKLSEFYPFLETSSIFTISNQTRYTINHSDLIKLENVYYNSPYSVNSFGDSDIIDIRKHGGFSLSQQITDIYEHETQRRIKPVDARIVSNDTFDLIPTPTTIETVYYEYSRYRTIDEIPRIFEDELIALVIYYKNDPTYQNNRSANNGNVFNFDRRGNTTESSSFTPQNAYDLRKDELKSICDDIKKKVNKLG